MDLQSNFHFISWEIRGFKNKPVTVFQTIIVKPFLITLSTNRSNYLLHIFIILQLSLNFVTTFWLSWNVVMAIHNVVASLKLRRQILNVFLTLILQR